MAKRPVLKIQYDSPVVLTFVLLCLGGLVLNHFTEGWTNSHLFCVYRSSLSDPYTYVRFFGHVLGHSGVTHCLGNLCLILVLGPIVESRYGSVNVLISIVITALVSGIVHFIFFPGYALLGASGVVFMLIFLASISGIRGGNIPISLILVAVVYLGQEVHGMFSDPTDNISQLTHIIGGFCGIVCGSFMAKKRR
ncbi:MAG: rhomboid family intramembrane serine protease [Ruminococcaceae bacterium]|nr:rhomboid family intramembrane serine protease [Oscillospiraceae bacterium]